MLVQTSVWGGSDVGWISINDTQDQLNTQIDLHKVEKVVQSQVEELKKTVDRANAAMDQANKAADSSNVNKAAIDAANSAIDEAKQSASDAVQKLQTNLESLIQNVKGSVDTTNDEVAKIKQSQADQIKDVTNQLNDAVAQAKAAADSLDAKTTALQTAVKNAQSDATVATQTASQANVTAIDAKGDAATALATSKQVTVDVKNAESDVMQAKATASEATITAGNAASDALVAKATASSASLTATNASSDVAQVSAAADSLGTRVTAVEGKTVANSTAIDENAKAITLKADQTSVDALKKTATDNSAAVSVLNDEIKSKVDSTTVNNIVDGKGFTTANTVQSIVDQKAGQLSRTITSVQANVDKNGKTISTVSDQLSNVTQTVDGLQTTVKSKADQSTINQLSNQLLAKVSTKDYQTEIAALTNALNLRVSKGDLISQINLEAGGDGLISVQNGKGKLMLDADSVVFGNKAFIPSAAITDIQADKITSGTLDAGMMRVINLTADSIHGGTLDVGDMNVKNLSANDIRTGTLSGIDISAADEIGNIFDMQGSKIKWFSKGFEVDKNGNPDDKGIHGEITVSSNDAYSIYQGTNTTPFRDTIHFATDKDFWFSTGTGYDSDKDAYDIGVTAEFGLLGAASSDYNSPVGFYANAANTNNFSILSAVNGISSVPTGNGVTFNTVNGFQINLKSVAHNGDGSEYFQDGNAFNIQKNDHVGAYFGRGPNGNHIDLVTAGDDCAININSPLNVNGSFHLSGVKNAVVKTTQGYIGINAYETADYYFGDIGENDTGASGQVTIGIDRIFNETVNTTVPYQVFITPYSDCHVWVDQRFDNRFVVKSDQPNAKFGWELKAKRRGYENFRLRHVDGFKEKEEF